MTPSYKYVANLLAKVNPNFYIISKFLYFCIIQNLHVNWIGEYEVSLCCSMDEKLYRICTLSIFCIVQNIVMANIKKSNIKESVIGIFVFHFEILHSEKYGICKYQGFYNVHNVEQRISLYSER